MSSNLEDHQAERVRYYGLLCGTVTNVVDPKGLHRVRANIPGIAEPESDWLFPITMGGGGPQRGGHVVPAVGSDVCVWFHMGDPEGRGAYVAAHWGVPAAGTEVPDDIKDAAGKNPEMVQSMEFPDPVPAGMPPGTPVGGLRVTVDERPGSREFQVLDVDANGEVQCAIAIDREKRAVGIQAVSMIYLKATGAIVLEGMEITINGRRVAPGPAQL